MTKDWYATLLQALEIGAIGVLMMFTCFALVSYNRVFGLPRCAFRSVMLPSFEYIKDTTLIKNFLTAYWPPTIPSAFLPYDEIDEVAEEDFDRTRVSILMNDEFQFLKKVEIPDIWKIKYGPMKEDDPFTTVFNTKIVELDKNKNTQTTMNTTNTIDGTNKKKGQVTQHTEDFTTGQ